MQPEKYYSNHLVAYEQPDCVGYLSLEVLPYLKGRKWDEIALGFVHSLNPDCIRVVKYNQGTKCDARTGRVTVQLDENENIAFIDHEVSVGLPEGIRNGHELEKALNETN